MKFHADCCFRIGLQHLKTSLPCQDYALAGSLDDRAYVVVSDGCSSGGHTDIGARLIGLAAARALRNQYVVDPVHFILAARPFDLRPEDWWATCLTASVNAEKMIVRVQGDGVVAFTTLAGSTFLIRMDWAKNMPCYPAYADDCFSQFMMAQEGPNVEAFRIEERLGEIVSVHYRKVIDVVDGHTILYPGPIRAIAIFSDGVTQIDGIAWQDAVRQLIAFKSIEGDFVKRRMNRFLKDVGKIGRGPIDDIAMAAIVVECDT